jgi:RND family efflux transporter MFP subunit
MGFLKQLVGTVVVVAAALYLWIAHVPGGAETLERWGVIAVLERAGVPLPAPPATEGGVQGQRGGFGRGPVSVVAAPPGEGRTFDAVVAIGTGQALRSVIINPEVSGRIAMVDVEAGTRVAEGDLIVRIENEAEQIAVSRAALVLADARDRLARVARLQSAGTATDIQIREAELALRQAELALRQAEFELARRDIRAPIPGWIGFLNAEVGRQVSPSAEITRIDDRSDIMVEFRVPERFVGQIKPGDTVEARPLARPDLSLTGTVAALDNRVDETSRTLRVQARIANDRDLLRAGMAFEIALSLTGEAFPSVDPLAIQWGSDGAFVWIVREGKAQRQAIRIVQRSARAVLVNAEFLPGDMVVSEGVQALRPGSEVQLRGAVPDAGAAEAARNTTRG